MSKIKIEWGGLYKKEDFNFDKQLLTKKEADEVVIHYQNYRGCITQLETVLPITIQVEQARFQSGEIDLLTYLDNISRDE